MERLAAYELSEPISVPDRTLHRVPLGSARTPLPGVEQTDAGIVFRRRGWYEVLLTVAWDSGNQSGTRFSHTAIPDHHPLHSEAINAKVLGEISGGRQLLRGNSIFGPDSVETIVLEVWQNSGDPVTVHEASLCVRPLGES
jgi:hypothetical protein